MLIFSELIAVLICGLLLVHLTSKEKNKVGIYSFISLCLGCALIITMFFIALYISPWLLHFYVVIVFLLTITRFRSFISKVK